MCELARRRREPHTGTDPTLLAAAWFAGGLGGTLVLFACAQRVGKRGGGGGGGASTRLLPRFGRSAPVWVAEATAPVAVTLAVPLAFDGLGGAELLPCAGVSELGPDDVLPVAEAELAPGAGDARGARRREGGKAASAYRYPGVEF